MVHAALLAMDKVYSDLRREVETFTNDRDSLNQQVLESREELDKLRHLVSSETNAIDTERKDLESEKAEFESFRTEALSQMESFREQLEVRTQPRAIYRSLKHTCVYVRPWNSRKLIFSRPLCVASCLYSPPAGHACDDHPGGET